MVMSLTPTKIELVFEWQNETIKIESPKLDLQFYFLASVIKFIAEEF